MRAANAPKLMASSSAACRLNTHQCREALEGIEARETYIATSTTRTDRHGMVWGDE
jgi:hypothetical protein